MNRLRQAFRSKTIWFALLLGILSVLQDFVGFLDADPRNQAIIGVVVSIVIVVLRYMTVEPMSDK